MGMGEQASGPAIAHLLIAGVVDPEELNALFYTCDRETKRQACEAAGLAVPSNLSGKGSGGAPRKQARNGKPEWIEMIQRQYGISKDLTDGNESPTDRK